MVEERRFDSYEVIAPYTAIKLTMLDAYHACVDAVCTVAHSRARGIDVSKVSIAKLRDCVIDLFLLLRNYVETSSLNSDVLLTKFEKKIMFPLDFDQFDYVEIFYKLQDILFEKKFTNIEIGKEDLEDMI